MQPEYLVVLYSKYSPQCQKFLQLYNQNPVNFIKMVCVDNKEFRERLIKSKLSINTVPTVLLFFPDNTHEKYEGPSVLNWLLEQIASNIPDNQQTMLEQPVQQQPVQQQPVQQQPVQQQPVQQQSYSMMRQQDIAQQNMIQSTTTPIDDINFEEQTKQMSIKELAALEQQKREALIPSINEK